MRLSHFLMPTSKEEPAEADTKAHSLMLRAGLIRRLTAGVHTFLPLGWRVMKKIENIIREEQNSFDCQELNMPVLSPKELWEESGRWTDFGDVLFRLKDRRGRDLCLAPTHEEVITDLARTFITSYRELPQTWYQIQTKFRDEARPRAGVIRGRQFTMMDAYSFDYTDEGLDKSYDDQRTIYERIFTRCGLTYKIVGASSGLMGGSDSQEFMLLTDDGEDTIIVCEHCGYAANSEVASTHLTVNNEPVTVTESIEDVHTPDMRTIDAVSGFLGIRSMDLMKSVIVMTSDNKPVLALIRGDLEVNETKLMTVLGSEYRPMETQEIEDLAGAEAGFIGPMGWKKKPRIIADNSIVEGASYVTGANKKDYHVRNAVPGRDFKIDEIADIRVVTRNTLCSICGREVEIRRAVEIGHIFKLGTKYTTALGAKYVDSDGKESPIIMGCYGIGLERIMAGAIDIHADKDGICWPSTISPFDFTIISLMQSDERVMKEAKRIYDELIDLGRDVIWDDREYNPGVKFKDADLVGIPIHIVIGKKFLDSGMIEIKNRKSQVKTEHKPEVVVEELISLYHRNLNELNEKARQIR